MTGHEVISAATNRADFMRDEGTALFTQLAQTALPEIFNLESSESIVDTIQKTFPPKHADHPLKLAFGVANCHTSMIYGELLPSDNPIYNHFKTEGQDRPASARRLLNKLKGHTFYEDIPDILHEAYVTTLVFPLKLLEYAHGEAGKKGIPPVIHKYKEIACAYRSPWLQQACTEAAMTANAVWGSFSTATYTKEPLFEPVLDLDFQTTGADTTFSFSDSATRALRSKLKERNADMLATFRRVGRSAHEKSDKGTTSGCPVAHDRPGFRLSDPTEAERLNGVAWITGASPEELMTPGKNGIAYGMEAAATLFERCEPYLKNLLEPTTGAVSA